MGRRDVFQKVAIWFLCWKTCEACLAGRQVVPPRQSAALPSTRTGVSHMNDCRMMILKVRFFGTPCIFPCILGQLFTCPLQSCKVSIKIDHDPCQKTECIEEGVVFWFTPEENLSNINLSVEPDESFNQMFCFGPYCPILWYCPISNKLILRNGEQIYSF